MVTSGYKNASLISIFVPFGWNIFQSKLFFQPCLPPVQVQRIEELNELDMELYDYAKDLFQQRYQYTRQQERRQQHIRSHTQLSHQGLGLSIGLWPSRPQAGSQSTLEEGDGEREDREEGGRTEEAGARLPTEDYMNQIINRW